MLYSTPGQTTLNVVVRRADRPVLVQRMAMPLFMVGKLASYLWEPEAPADEFNGSLAELLAEILIELGDGNHAAETGDTAAAYMLRAAVAAILLRNGARQWGRNFARNRIFIIELKHCVLGLRYDFSAVLSDVRKGQPGASSPHRKHRLPLLGDPTHP